MFFFLASSEVDLGEIHNELCLLRPNEAEIGTGTKAELLTSTRAMTRNRKKDGTMVN